MAIDQGTAYFLGIVAFASFAWTVFRCRTVLLGFTVFSFLSIGGYSFSAFLLGHTFQLDDAWITDSHLWVFAYSALGLIAFAVGAYVAWRPLRRNNSLQRQSLSLPWFNPRFAYLCIGLAVLTTVLSPVAYKIPTVRAAWSSYMELLKFGLLVALAYGGSTGKYSTFVISFAVFWVVVIFQAVLSGHIGAGGPFLIQALLVGCFWKRGFNIRSAVGFTAGTCVIAFLLFGWLSSRSLIRSGNLDQYGATERVAIFLQNFQAPSFAVNDIQKHLFLRADMSDILAAQVQHQPEIEPYAYGGTVFPSVFIALVPRFIWEDKTFSLGGSDFVSKYSGLKWGAGTSIGMPYQFELYANGGSIAVVVGLFLVGWLTAKLELLLFNNKYSLPQILGLMILTNIMSRQEQTFTSIIMSMGAGYIGIYVLGKWLERQNKVLGFWDNSKMVPRPSRRYLDTRRKLGWNSTSNAAHTTQPRIEPKHS